MSFLLFAYLFLEKTEKNTVKKASKSNFSNDWLEDPNFKEWLGKASSNSETRCKFVIKYLNHSIWEEKL